MSYFAYSIKDESIINDFMKEYYPSFVPTETVFKFLQVFEKSILNIENMNIDLCNAFQELKESVVERQ